MDFNTVNAILSLILGILGLVAGPITSYVFQQIERKVKAPSWSAKSRNVIRNNFASYPDVTLSFRNKTINSLTVSRIIFWNAGGQTIRRGDIASTSPLRITPVAGLEILDVKVIAVSEDSSHVVLTLAPDARTILIELEYLERAQGAVIEVIHSGEDATFQIQGKIIDGEAIQYRNLQELENARADRKRLREIERQMRLIAIPAGISIVFNLILYLIGGVEVVFSSEQTSNGIELLQQVFNSFVVIVLYIFYPLVLYMTKLAVDWSTIKWKVMKQALPRDADLFLTDIPG